MKLSDLRPGPGSRPKPTRRGRGIGSGLGKTSGRGHKGQKARSGGGVRRGFEGGQMPLFRRIPKRGFTNIFAKEVAVIKVQDLNCFPADTEVTPELLLSVGLVDKSDLIIKLLGNGDVDRPLTVKLHRFSKGAAEKVTAAGGKVEVI